MPKLKLLIAAPEYLGSGGGIMTFYRSLARALVDAGINVRVIQGSAFLAGERDAGPVDGVFVETLEAHRLQKFENLLPQLASAPTFRRAIAAAWGVWEQALEGDEFDVVEAADFGMLFVPPLLRRDVPCVMQMHASAGQIAVHDPLSGQELDGLLALAVETEMASQASVVQSYSQANSLYWQAQSSRRVACIHPAWCARDLPVRAPVRDRLVVIGRVQSWKGPKILCEALRLMGRNAPNVDWYGRDTPFGDAGCMTSQWLKETYPDVWGVNIVHKQNVDAGSVPVIQSSALVNIVPSTWDVFNFTAVEAMSSGRPVICSDGAGASELLTDGVTGFTYAADDPAALATAIEAAMALSPARQIEMGAAAREAIRVALDPATIARQRIDAYEKAIASGNIARPIPDWLVGLCKPADAAGSELAFLDHLPLKPIARYAAGRALRKIFRQ